MNLCSRWLHKLKGLTGKSSICHLFLVKGVISYKIL